MRCVLCVAVLMCSVPGLASAQLYQCAGPEGRPVVTDKPCDKDAKPLVLPPPARATFEMEVSSRTAQKLETPLQYEYYEIRGTTVADLRYDILLKARETRWGKAVGTMHPRWDVRYQVHSDGADRCAITKVAVIADSTVWIPRWMDEAQAEPSVREVANAFVQSVAAHEEDHVRIHVASGQEMVQSLRAIEPARSCEEIQAQAQQRADTIQLRSFQRQVDYDRRTSGRFRR